MKKAKLNKFVEQLLLDKKRSIMQKLETMSRESRAKESIVEADILDQSAKLDSAMDEAVMTSYYEQNLRRIDDALDRVWRGNYGVCEECGIDIPEKRLQICPEAVLCVDCQGQIETRRYA